MSTNHGSVATHAQSLPPFAQAFSSHSLSNISPNNALPPIQSCISSDSYRVDSPSNIPRSRPSSNDSSEPKSNSRKRTRQDITSSSRDDDPDDSERASPRLPHIKQEQGHDMLEPSPPPPDQPVDHRMPLDDAGAPQSAGSTASPMKRRRVTVSGAPHPLNTDVRPPADQTNSTPISPVVMGFTINRDNPAAMEQVRSTISVKQKQKALIEQRRGSQAVGGPSSATTSNTNPPQPSLSEERISAPASKSTALPRASRRSPNTNTSGRRVGSPSPRLVPAQPQLHPPVHNPPAPTQTQTLPFPPISFARRRAGLLGGAGKKKPADILISPREAQSSDQLQPSIQSAPPIPHAGQGAFQSGRLSMALPRLPPVMGATDNIRRVASNVPPTPTRLSLLRPAATATPMISVSGRSPPAANVPIASTLVPPTPASLHHPGYSGDKTAFLAPFEIFYDALNDSKQLKVWLGEQLQRSNSLVQTLTQQQDKLNETIDAAVEKRVSGMRLEMAGLRRRIEDLEDALRIATSGRRGSADMTGGPGPLKGKQPLRNGMNPGPPESYTFPPPSHEPPRHRADSIRRAPSPGWPQERDLRGPPPIPLHPGDSDRHASPPYDSRRLATVSATRLDPLRSRETDSPSHHPRPAINLPSPPQPYREHLSNQPMRDHRDHHSRPTRNERETQQRPGLTRQHSHTEGGSSPNLLPPTPSTGSSHSTHQQQPCRRPGSRRNSVAMSPEGPSGDSS
ncbi:hypothetical protein P691DRAFT_794587 [Macrolepiota fuliginosa MF-IS2]|uniref:Uncharacterized protein n=1 Tax=Macrolepiota fuliginosa MF-IS2 TaxID=1400762 RepID=A0A9P5XPV4_9AGAR|nr:hypothetical protein P691DRAFT_794587 [Macrolepiota fuliginosa MF-IS2]